MNDPIKVTSEQLLEEARRLHARMVELDARIAETLIIARETTRDLEAGRRRIDATRKLHGY